MKIYVDFDDVICETARSLAAWARNRFGGNASYEAIRWFDLRKSLNLNEEQYRELMDYAHHEETLRRYLPARGAVDAIKLWQRAGHEVAVVTGRPVVTRSASRAWLDLYGLGALPLVFVDKYGREPPPPPGVQPALTADQFAKLAFDLAVEDAPPALDMLTQQEDLRIFIYDRPWNRDYNNDHSRTERFSDWHAIAKTKL